VWGSTSQLWRSEIAARNSKSREKIAAQRRFIHEVDETLYLEDKRKDSVAKRNEKLQREAAEMAARCEMEVPPGGGGQGEVSNGVAPMGIGGCETGQSATLRGGAAGRWREFIPNFRGDGISQESIV